MRYITIIGSTGSIGRQTLEVVDNLHDVQVEGLSAYSNIDLLEQQARRYRPDVVCVVDEIRAAELKKRLSDTPVQVLAGTDGLLELAALPKSDTVVAAAVGIAGLMPTVAAICARKRIALANKETLVTAGDIIMPLAQEMGAEIVPVDSEHSAIFQCLQGQQTADGGSIELILTASGGPFFGKTAAELQDVTPAAALKHPNWSMGAKVTIDSATLMNKGLEVLEASHLFGVPVDSVRVVVHRQSIVHSMVRFPDNAVLAQLGVPDMKLPIQYALTYPRRCAMWDNQLDFTACGALTFEPPDTHTFGCLDLAYEAGRTGGTLPCVMNAANEVCVERFLTGKLPFLDIQRGIAQAMEQHTVIAHPTLEDILAVDEEVRERMEQKLGSM